MKIEYILSDTTKSATTKALTNVVYSAEEKIMENYIVIVPETKSIIIEKEILKLSKNSATANIFVYSFVRLLKRLNFVDTEKIISKQTATMLIRKIICDNFNKLKCYKKTAKNINFAEKIYETLQQFKSSEVGVDDLKLAAINSDEALKLKLEDIIIIFEEYQKILSNGLFDDCDKLNLIKTFAKNSDFLKDSNVYVVGFDNITNEMVSVLEEIAKTTKSITFSSVYFSDKRHDKYIQNNELFLKFRRVAENLKYPYNPTFQPDIRKGDLYYIANNLFLPNIKRVKYNGAVKIFEAESKKQELKFVANNILSQVQNGARFKDFGVMLLDVENDSKILEEVFDEYKINYFMNKQIDISNHSLIYFIKNCFDLYNSHLSNDKVLKFLKSSFVNEKEIFDFENFVNEFGINHNEFLKLLDKNYESKTAKFNIFNQILIKFQQFYNIFAENIKKSKTANNFCDVILFVLDYFDVEKKLVEIAEFELKQELFEKSEITKIIYLKVKEFLQIIKNFLGNMQFSVDEFLQVFLTGFSSKKINLVPASIDCVIVQNNTDGFFDIKNLFIVGADEEKFPIVLRDSGIILDSELEKTNILSGKKIEPTTKEINSREKFAAYEALLEPKENLFVSYSKIGVDGGMKKPSIIINKLKSLFGDAVVDIHFKEINNVSHNNFEKNFAKNINKFYDGEISIDDLSNEYAMLKSNMSEEFKNFVDFESKYIPKFNITNASELFFDNDKTSSSQLERYFSCPYSFFINYGLRLKENKNVKISKLDIGVILHKVAEIFMKNIDFVKNLDESSQFAKIKEIINNVFDDFKLSKNSNFATIKFLYNESLRFCKYLLFEQNNSGFKAKYNEFAFFGQNALVLKLKNGKELKLEGKIDRIDEFGDYVRIIDYKTGAVDSDLYAVYYGKKIQLLSYLSAISQIKDKKVAGLLYLPIHSEYVEKDENYNEKYKMNGFLLNDIETIKNMDFSLSFDNPKSRFIPITIKSNNDVRNRNTFEFSRPGKKILSSDEFEILKNYNEKLCSNACEEILEGYIEPSPMKKGDSADTMPCKWCPFVGFCGLERTKFKDGRRCDSGIELANLRN